jgi:hypothetical protein
MMDGRVFSRMYKPAGPRYTPDELDQRRRYIEGVVMLVHETMLSFYAGRDVLNEVLVEFGDVVTEAGFDDKSTPPHCRLYVVDDENAEFIARVIGQHLGRPVCVACSEGAWPGELPKGDVAWTVYCGLPPEFQRAIRKGMRKG